MDAKEIELLIYAGLALLFLGGGYLFGKINENKHLKSLAMREAACRDFFLTSLKNPIASSNVRPPRMVVGEVVISSDKFKNFLFDLRNTFGGEVKSFTRLYDRARREATLRMIEEAQRAGYNAVCNVRYDTVDIAGNASSGSKNTLKVATSLVSGTAYVKA